MRAPRRRLSGVTTPAPVSQARSGAAVLGRADSRQNPSQTRFLSHDLIELRVDVGGTSPNVEVRTTWLDAQGHVLGGEMHRPRIGQQTMVFPCPSPRRPAARQLSSPTARGRAIGA